MPSPGLDFTHILLGLLSTLSLSIIALLVYIWRKHTEELAHLAVQIAALDAAIRALDACIDRRFEELNRDAVTQHMTTVQRLATLEANQSMMNRQLDRIEAAAPRRGQA